MDKKEFKKWFFTDNHYNVNSKNCVEIQEIGLEMGCLCHTGKREMLEWRRGFKGLGFRTDSNGQTFFQQEKTPRPNDAP